MKHGNSGSTMRSLVASLITLCICAVMFVAATFAWYTDSIGTGGNRIVAGNMDFALFYVISDDTEPVKLDMEKGQDDTWEVKSWPASTFNLTAGEAFSIPLRIENTGTLPINFKAEVTPESYQDSSCTYNNIAVSEKRDCALQFRVPADASEGDIDLKITITVTSAVP